MRALARRRARHVARIALAVGLLGAAGACPGSSAPAGPPSLFLSVVPPGSNGNSAGGSATTPPRNFEDQLTLYGDLSYAKPGLTATSCEPPASLSAHQAASNLACNYYKDGNLQPQTVASTETVKAPSGNAVTIQRDGWGVPFVSGATRADTLFGVGYASAEDRLWLYDILRNIGRGTLSEFLGPADGYLSYDANMASIAGYDEDELTAMTTQAESAFGALGPRSVGCPSSCRASARHFAQSSTRPRRSR